MDVRTADLAREYEHPDLGRYRDECDELAAGCEGARSGAALLEVVARWNAARERVDTMRELASVRYRQDTRDAAAREEHAFFTRATPALRELEARWAGALVHSPHRAALDEAYGPQLLVRLGCAARAYAPALADAVAEEAELVARYTALTARAAIEFEGRTVNEGGLAPGFVARERERRLEAQRARDRWLGTIGDEVDGIYDRLVKLRDAMGRALGHDGFAPLGYALLGRVEYGPDEVARFRDEVRREIVPLAARVVASRARRLGLSRALFHDEPVAAPEGNPAPRGDAAFCFAQAHAALSDMGPEPRAFVDAIAARGMVDLANRDGKAAGAFCANFTTLGTPFVFANLAGTHHDVGTLMHECGHALQAYLSRHQPLLEYRFPTYEAAEVHSMSLEYLAWPWADRFFGDEPGARRYRALHLEDRVLGLPYLVLIDHFQHDVYAAPGLSPAARRARFRELERVYLPWRDYGPAGSLPALEGGAFWHRQLHLFHHPFYYVDYALAQACALQLWHRAQSDHAAALADLLAICRTGGSTGFSAMVRTARLRSPLEPGCLAGVARAAAEALGV